MKLQASPIIFPNIGAYLTDVPEDVLSVVRSEVEEIKKDFSLGVKHNQMLAGHLKHEYQLTKCVSVLEGFVLQVVGQYEKEFSYLPSVSILDRDLPLKIIGCWVNFQTKFEFNPPHIHSGVFSFVLWLDIPYTMEQERTVFSEMKDKEKVNGQFIFEYTNSLGQISSFSIDADKSFNGKLCLFPSRMRHFVPPFYTSDNQRISVSGNIKLLVEKYDN